MDVVAPIVQGGVTAIPLIGITNDVNTFIKGEDIYGNEAEKEDYLLSMIDVATCGFSKKIIGFIIKNPKVSKAVKKAMGRINTGATMGTVSRTIVNESKKQEVHVKKNQQSRLWKFLISFVVYLIICIISLHCFKGKNHQPPLSWKETLEYLWIIVLCSLGGAFYTTFKEKKDKKD